MASEDVISSGSTLFVIQFVNLYEQTTLSYMYLMVDSQKWVCKLNLFRRIRIKYTENYKYCINTNMKVIILKFTINDHSDTELSSTKSVFFSSPVVRRLLSIVCRLSVVCQHLPCEHDTGHIMHAIVMEICQNVLS